MEFINLTEPKSICPHLETLKDKVKANFGSPDFKENLFLKV